MDREKAVDRPDTGLLITARGIAKSFQNNGVRVEVLSKVDFEMDEGGSVAVVGASGIGKSTFLHILGTLDRPTGGRLLMRHEDVFRFTDERLARFRNRFVGFVFQFHHLLPEFTALENAMMPALIRGDSPPKAREAAEAILVRVGLKDRLIHKSGELSGGEQQRVALARALVLSPPLLLADEPTGNLDKHNSEGIHRLLMELNRERKMAIVVVTHNLELASLMSRRVTISEGHLSELD